MIATRGRAQHSSPRERWRGPVVLEIGLDLGLQVRPPLLDDGSRGHSRRPAPPRELEMAPRRVAPRGTLSPPCQALGVT